MTKDDIPAPVAWQLRHPNLYNGEWYEVDQERYERATAGFERRCLYTSPPKREPEPVIDKSAAIRIATSLGWTPKREWQGLTDEEIDEGQRQSWVDKQAFESAVWWAEAKLKEKNSG